MKAVDRRDRLLLQLNLEESVNRNTRSVLGKLRNNVVSSVRNIVYCGASVLQLKKYMNEVTQVAEVAKILRVSHVDKKSA